MIHAIDRLPIIVKDTATIRNSIPLGSKVRKGRNVLERIVKTGENRNITRVFLPIK
jgi:hypothetical protein